MALPWPFRRASSLTGAMTGSVATHTATDGRDFLLNDPDGWEVDQPHLWWTGPAGGDGTGGPWASVLPDSVAGWGKFGTAAIPAVTRCTSLIADTLAGMPWQTFRGREQLPAAAWIEDPQALRWDDRLTGPTSMAGVPDWRLSVFEFRSQMITSLLWHGEAFIYTPVRDSNGQPIPPVWLIHPDDVKIRGGRWWVGRDDDQLERLDASELIAVRGLMRPGKTRGVGVIQSHLHDLKMAGHIRDYADGMLQRGVPAGYLKVTAPDLTEDEASRLRSRWESAHGGTRRRIAVLGATTEFHPLNLDPKALQLIEMRRYSLLEIALMFGVPPYKLGIDDGTSNTYANVESRNIDFVTDTLLSWTRRIETVFEAQLARGTTMRINLDALRRADTKTRYEAHQIGIDGGWLTVDEVRDLEGLPERSQAGLADLSDPRNVAEMVQKVYLGIGRGITPDEARRILRAAGAPLDPGTPPEAIAGAPAQSVWTGNGVAA